MARTKAPPSLATRQTEYADDVINSLRWQYHRSVRHHLSGPYREQYFIIREGQSPITGGWQGIDLDSASSGSHLGAPAGPQGPRAGQTLGMNTNQQRSAGSRTAVLDALPPDLGLGRAAGWVHFPGNPSELTGAQQDSLFAATLQKASARLVQGQGYVRTLTEYTRSTEAVPPVIPDHMRQHWKNVFGSYPRAYQVAAVINQAEETADLVEYLLSRNVVKTTTALPADIARRYYQRIAELELAAQEEGYAASSASQQDFWAFVRAHASWCQADLILTDEGCLCAIWYTEDDTRVEVEFLGDGQGKLLVFGSRGSSLIVVPDITTADLNTIGQKISVFAFVSVAG